MQHYHGDHFGLIVAYWGLALILVEPQISQTDYNEKHETFGEVLDTRTPFSVEKHLCNSLFHMPLYTYYICQVF